MKKPLITFFTSNTKTFVPYFDQIVLEMDKCKNISELNQCFMSYDIDNFKEESDREKFLLLFNRRKNELMDTNGNIY